VIARRLWLLAAVAMLATCSTLAPPPAPQECNDDDDCSDGFLCAFDLLVCVPGGDRPPFAHLAFDIQEFEGSTLVARTEVAGCDALVEFSTANGISIDRQKLQQQFELSAYLVEPSEPPLVGEHLPIGSAFELSQSSRFANRPPTYRPRVSYPTFEDEMMTIVAPTVVRFPRYHPLDPVPAMLGTSGFVTWQIIPAAVDTLERAPMYQMIVPAVTEGFCDEQQDCCPDFDPDELDQCVNFCLDSQCTLIGNPRFEYGVVYDEDSSRELAGQVVRVRPDGTSAPASDATVQLRYADSLLVPEQRIGVFALSDIPVDARVRECGPEAGSSCIPGESYCEPMYEQCKLALAGRAASVPRTADAMGNFSARVYRYQFELPMNVNERWFTASVSRPTGAVPSSNSTFEVVFSPMIGSAGMWQKKLCMPDWGPPITAEVRVSGEPVDFVGTGPGAFRCCDVGCLPRTPEDAAMLTAPPRASACNGATAAGSVPSATITAPASLTAEEEELWVTTIACEPPAKDEDGNIGALTRDVDCTPGDETSTCTLVDLGAGDDGSERGYALRIESPVGSVLGSISMPIGIDDGAPLVQHDIILPTRVLLRGMVRLQESLCDPETAEQTNCGSEGALVLAERVRMPGEDPAITVGPFFHEVSTFYDPVAARPGAYVLPLDPGVYLVTALPASGSPGGPADITVVDLRESDGEENLDFLLRAGVLVSMTLEGSPRGALVTPLDIGGWRNEDFIRPGGGPLDLNLVGECLTPPEEGALACKIRRLIPAANLPPNQNGIVRFTARAAGSSGNCGER
jgi:hypothetical protein